MLPVEAANKVLAANVRDLLDAHPTKLPRPDMAARMKIGDKTLGFIKAGTGNPTLESISLVAKFFRLQPWELLKPKDSGRVELLAKLSAMATPRSRAALETISRAADEGRLTEDDLVLLQHIAQRFMTE